ncbi:hypothetical protein XELAEV_18014135mg [Xenopus laevis]|uniref:Uncharacterized protein n=1 Tax=Xenopus laevis TaxID=8355 RepID=A0A974DHD8_XENLA|nr:hypothetical protein XELAEV_18014135mg [Xenopus laevis]
MRDCGLSCQKRDCPSEKGTVGSSTSLCCSGSSPRTVSSTAELELHLPVASARDSMEGHAGKCSPDIATLTV